MGSVSALGYKRLVLLLRPRIAALLWAALVFLQATPSLAFNSSAWTRPKGQLWTLLSVGFVSAGDQFDQASNRRLFNDAVDGQAFQDESFYAQVEYGLIDELTLHLELPYKRIFVEQASVNTAIEAPGNLYAGARVNLLKLLPIETRITWSLELGFSIPTGYTRNLNPSVGPGNVEFDVKTAVGYGFQIIQGLPAYTQLGMGIRARSTAYTFSGSADCPSANEINCQLDNQPNFSDEFLFLAEFGITPFKGSVLLFGKTLGNVSLLEPELGFSAANPIPTRQRIVKLGAGTILYPLRFFDVPYAKNVGLVAQYYSTVWGQNAPATDDIFLGLEYSHAF
ncbi:MAG: hypothetical protein AAGD10_16780 [Myxococcota bacterium]